MRSSRPLTALLLTLALGACRPSRPAPPPSASAPAPASSSAAPARGAFGARAIDRALRAAWEKGGVTPAPPADDATYLRRVTLDLTGTIPRDEDVRAFLASRDPDKRGKLVAALLASPAYAEHWALVWDDELMGQKVRGPAVDRDAFRAWLRARFAENAPWDQIVRELVSATGVNSAGGPRAAGRGPVLDVPDEDDEAGDEGREVNGAVNFHLRFADAPEDISGTASRAFLGVQIQCAQCHDHKSEKWTQADYRRFTSAFWFANARPIDRGKAMKSLKRVELVDTPRVPPRFTKNPERRAIAEAKPTALDGTDLSAKDGAPTRAALARWMTSKENPWFARAFVNRVWGHLLGRGFYDPVDDIRPSNEPTAPELLDAIAKDFADSGFDVKRLFATLSATEAYGLSSSATAKADPENRLWAKFRLVPLGREELLRALLRATDAEEAARRANLDVDKLRATLVRQYGFLFEVDEDSDARDYAGTVSQALMLLNGAFVGHASRALPGGALDAVLALPGDDGDRVRALYLRVLSRPATEDEVKGTVAYVSSATHAAPRAAGGGGKGQGPLARLGRKPGKSDPRRDAWEDVMWTLLNSSEFFFNH